jgi:hypothetical protein
MFALHELQIEFARAVFDEKYAQVFARKIRRNGLGGERRIRIYRNNFRISLTETLAAIYPVTARLVGEGFFRQTAGSYVREVRSTSGDIRQYGRTFPEFLAALPGIENLAYLPDVARLEWAYHSVFHSAIKVPLDPLSLRAVAADDYPMLRFALQPAVRLMRSDYPVLRIWQLNLEEWQGETVNLYEGGVQLLIQRHADTVTVVPLAAGDYCLLESLNRGQPLAEGIAIAASVDLAFDPGAALTGFFRQGLLVDFFTDAANDSPASFHSHPEV